MRCLLTSLGTTAASVASRCVQDAFAEENGLPALSSLLSTSKAPVLLQAVLRCLGAYVQQACIPGDGAGHSGSVGQLGQPSRAAGNVLLLERSRAVPAAVRLASAHENPEFTAAEAKAVSLAALELLLKVSAVPEMRTSLRYASVEPPLPPIHVWCMLGTMCEMTCDCSYLDRSLAP